MTKSQLLEQWNQFRGMLDTTRKMVNQFPEDKLGFRPTPAVRSVSELVAHNYHFLTEAVNSVRSGKFIPTGEPKFKTKSELLKWVDKQVSEAYAGVGEITDQQLVSRINVLGESFAGWQLLDMVYQEHLHHRGQLAVYLRMLGIQPISVYDHGAKDK